jgi:hypothetical protein
MIHRCPNCPADTQNLENYLFQQFQPEIDEDDEPLTIQFQQWTTVDGSELVEQIRPVADFISILGENLTLSQLILTLENLRQSISRSVRRN